MRSAANQSAAWHIEEAQRKIEHSTQRRVRDAALIALFEARDKGGSLTLEAIRQIMHERFGERYGSVNALRLAHARAMARLASGAEIGLGP